MILSHVEALVDNLGDGFDLGVQLLFDGDEAEAVLVRDEVDGQAQVAESTGAPYSVEVGLGRFGEVKVYDDIHGLNVNASRQKI